jgi:hypothetical protein
VVERLGSCEAVPVMLVLTVGEAVLDFVEAIEAVTVPVVLADFDSFAVADVV